MTIHRREYTGLGVSRDIMATDKKVNEDWFVELTGKEAVDIIGLLAAQLADKPLIGNQGGACPDIKITDGRKVTAWMAFIVDTKPRHCTGEILEGGQTIIVLSRRDASNMIGFLGSLLAGVSPCNPNLSVQGQYRLSFSVKSYE